MFEIDGILQQVDPVARELRVLVNGTVLTLDVPVDCRIFLNGERVKLRLLQALDPVQIRYVQSADLMAARSIEVSWFALGAAKKAARGAAEPLVS